MEASSQAKAAEPTDATRRANAARATPGAVQVPDFFDMPSSMRPAIWGRILDCPRCVIPDVAIPLRRSVCEPSRVDRTPRSDRHGRARSRTAVRSLQPERPDEERRHLPAADRISGAVVAVAAAAGDAVVVELLDPVDGEGRRGRALDVGEEADAGGRRVA